MNKFKKIINIIGLFGLSAFSFASSFDYKVTLGYHPWDGGSSASAPWSAPVGEGALHPNGITVTCLGMTDGETFDINGITYTVVYSKNDAAIYAETACTSNVTDMANIFYNNTTFNRDISHWDTSNVTTFFFAFYNADIFNQPIGNWDLSSALTTEGMFRNTNDFNQPIGNWDTSNVQEMTQMFQDADGFNQPLNNWDVSNVFNMSNMFRNADLFNQPLNNWDTSSVLYMPVMFEYAKVFNQPICDWDVSNVVSNADFKRYSSFLSDANSPKFSGHGSYGTNCP